MIDLIIDAGKLPRNKPSTVIDLTKPKLKIFRQGDIVLSRRKTFISNSPGQTKKIAIFILKKFLAGKWAGPLIFIIKGDFGAGKTIFIKGIGENLGIRNIVSPSFTVAYEYLLDHPYFKNLAHYDLYNIDDPEEFRYLGIGRYLNKGNIICFEWGDKAGEIYENLKKSGTIVYININYIDKKTREIIVNS